MERHIVAGWGLCDAYRQLFDEGLVTLIECDPQRNGVPADQNSMRPEQAWRTGRLAQLKRKALAGWSTSRWCSEVPCVFVEPSMIEQLPALVGPVQ